MKDCVTIGVQPVNQSCAPPVPYATLPSAPVTNSLFHVLLPGPAKLVVLPNCLVMSEPQTFVLVLVKSTYGVLITVFAAVHPGSVESWQRVSLLTCNMLDCKA